MLSSSKTSTPQDVGSSQTPVKSFLKTLQSNFENIEDVENALLEALATLKLVPPGFDFQKSLPLTCEEILHAISSIQHSILTSIFPIWFHTLRERNHSLLVKQFFCPLEWPTKDAAMKRIGNPIGVDIAKNGLSNILPFLSTLDVNSSGPGELFEFCLTILGNITAFYPLDVVFEDIFLLPRSLTKDQNILLQCWEDHIRDVASLPGKVANVVHRSKSVKPSHDLEHGSYFSSICLSTERVLLKASRTPLTDIVAQAISRLLLKLINQGLFPSINPNSSLQPSFFTSTLPTIQRRIRVKYPSATSNDAASSAYTGTWCTAIRGLTFLSQQNLIRSLFSSLGVDVGIDVSWQSLQQIKNCVATISGLLGNFKDGSSNGIRKVVSTVLLSADKVWDLGLIRVIVCWIADSKSTAINEKGVADFLAEILDVFTNPDHIRHSLYSRQRYITSLFLITLVAVPQSSNTLQQLSFSSPFISSITTFLSHSDLSIRQCGMLVAEVVAERCRQKLNFGGWDGDSEHLKWVRAMRGWTNDWSREAFNTLESTEDRTSEVDEEESDAADNVAIPEVAADSDDESLSGYSSSDRSSRPPSPTASELEEMEKDPTLRVGRSKPVPKPVYLTQLVSLLRKSGTDDKDAAEITEVILNSAESLIRRKKGFGYELEENAVQLTISFIMLRNNYEIENFNEKRQGALIALVECCPKKAAQTLVEQFFTNQYSTTDRLTILTSLALGARTLAGLAPSSTREYLNPKAVFPSKLLPPTLHRRYATKEEIQQTQVQKVLGDITRLALDKSKNEAENALIAAGNKEIVRTRMLRLGSVARGQKGGKIEVLEATSSALTKPPAVPPTESFTVLAAEYFIMPLINHMWLYLRDTDTRIRKDVAGTGIILDTTVLTQFLGTLAILVYAARNSPAFLNIIAPAALEIAVTLGSRPIEAQGKSNVDPTNSLSTATPATVLTAAMELTLTSLDASTSLDDGQTLALENTALLMAISTWAGEILNVLEKGHHMLKGGGETEGKLNAVTAGVVIRIDRITEKWGRAM